MNNDPYRNVNVQKLLCFLSLLRILLVPVIIWLYFGPRQFAAVIAAVAVSGASDILSSIISRKRNMVSDAARVLHPIADQLTQAALMACLMIRYPRMWILLTVFAVRAGLMFLWGYLTRDSADAANSVKWCGKASTAVCCAVMIFLMLAADIPETGVHALMLLCGAMMLFSLVMYGRHYHAILDKMPSGSRQQKILRTARNVVLILIWGGIITACLIHRKELSAEGIVNYMPKNLWLAAVVMLALFALKSLSIVIYSGLLYAANGILFPLPIAIILNLIGTVIMVTLPYQIGRKTGASAVDAIRGKYSKVEAIHNLRAQNDFFFSFLVRMVRLPCDVASLYMGAVHVSYRKYLLGSLLGLLPHTITYPIMGMSIRNIRSPKFLISLCAEIAYILMTSAVYTLYCKKNKADQ